jgi:hypothetical protein
LSFAFYAFVRITLPLLCFFMADRRDDRRFPHLFEWILPAKIQDLCDICVIYRARSAIDAALSAYSQAES